MKKLGFTYNKDIQYECNRGKNIYEVHGNRIKQIDKEIRDVAKKMLEYKKDELNKCIKKSENRI